MPRERFVEVCDPSLKMTREAHSTYLAFSSRSTGLSQSRRVFQAVIKSVASAASPLAENRQKIIKNSFKNPLFVKGFLLSCNASRPNFSNFMQHQGSQLLLGSHGGRACSGRRPKTEGGCLDNAGMTTKFFPHATRLPQS